MLRRLVLRASSIARPASTAYFSPHLRPPSSPALLLKCPFSSTSQIPNASFVGHSEDNADQSNSPQATATISVDRSGLYNPPGTAASPPLISYFALHFSLLLLILTTGFFLIFFFLWVNGRAFS